MGDIEVTRDGVSAVNKLLLGGGMVAAAFIGGAMLSHDVVHADGDGATQGEDQGAIGTDQIASTGTDTTDQAVTTSEAASPTPLNGTEILTNATNIFSSGTQTKAKDHGHKSSDASTATNAVQPAPTPGPVAATGSTSSTASDPEIVSSPSVQAPATSTDVVALSGNNPGTLEPNSNSVPTISLTTVLPATSSEVAHPAVNDQGILVDSLTSPEAPNSQPVLSQLNGVVDSVAETFLDLTGNGSKSARTPSTAPVATSAASTAPNIIIIGSGSDVTVDPDGTIHASSPDVTPGATTSETTTTSASTIPEAVPPVSGSADVPVPSTEPGASTTASTPEVVNGKVSFDSVVSYPETNVVDLSQVVTAINTVDEVPLTSDDFPNPDGYRRIPRGDTWSDFSYTFNKGEDGSIPTCDNEQFDSPETIATTLLLVRLQAEVAHENGLPGFEPMLLDATSTHAAEHYNGGDIDIHSIYVDGVYNHNLNLAWLKKVVLLRNPDGSPIIHHIQTSDVELAANLNALIKDTYGPNARPKINVQKDHLNHFHISTDDKDTPALPHASPNNVNNCQPFSGFRPAAMSYAEAFGQAASAAVAASGTTTPNLAGTAAANNLVSTGTSPILVAPPSEITAFSVEDVLNAPAIRVEGNSVHDQLLNKLGALASAGREAVQLVDLPTEPAAPTVPTAPAPTAGGSVAHETSGNTVATHSLAEVHPAFKYLNLLSDKAKGYTCAKDEAETKSARSKMNGGTLSFDEAYGPAFDGSDVYLMWLSAFDSKRPGNPNNRTDARMFTARSYREANFRPCSVGDFKADKNGVILWSYGIVQIRKLAVDSGNPVYDPQTNLDPILAAENSVAIFEERGDAPWYTPAGLSAEALHAADLAETKALALIEGTRT